MNNEYLKPLLGAVIRLLRPLVLILLRNGVSFQSFSDLAKWVYVDVATKDFCIKGRKQSISRVSVVTGLSRKEVLRVKQIAKPDDRESCEKYNRAARVIAAWRRESDFTDEKGKPIPLPLAGPGATFSALVKRFSGDIPVRATLDELIRINAVQLLKDGQVCLIERSFIPQNIDADKFHILGKDSGHLISTIAHNLDQDQENLFFQREVAYDNLPNEILPKFQKLAAKKAQSLLEGLDKWLAKHDRDVSTTVNGQGRNIAGLGIYYFEEPYQNEED